MRKLLFSLSLVFCNSVFAGDWGLDDIKLRGSLMSGSWRSKFRQAGYGKSTVADKTALTTAFSANFGISSPSFPVYFEAEGAYFMENYPKTESPYECQYSEYGLVFGYTRPGNKIEPYVGVGAGTYVFENIKPLDYFGTSVIGGISAYLYSLEDVKFGLRVEYRYIYFQRDSGSSINKNYLTTANILSAGIFIGF